MFKGYQLKRTETFNYLTKIHKLKKVKKVKKHFTIQLDFSTFFMTFHQIQEIKNFKDNANQTNS